MQILILNQTITATIISFCCQYIKTQNSLKRLEYKFVICLKLNQ